MKNFHLAINWCAAMHDYSIVNIPICLDHVIENYCYAFSKFLPRTVNLGINTGTCIAITEASNVHKFY